MYQINQNFTRLAPAIYFSDVALDANAWCVLESPPKHLMTVHSPALIKAWHERIVQALVKPSQVKNHKGQLMHHCAAIYASRCQKGELVMVSIRDARHRHPLATVSFLMKEQRVQVHKFSGFSNRRVSDEAFELIQDCRRQLQRQWQRVEVQQLSDRPLMAA